MALASDRNIAAGEASGKPRAPSSATYALQLAVSAGLLIIAALAWYAASAPLLIGVILIGFAGSASLVAIEVHSIFSRRGGLAPLLVIGGTLFWFLIDAMELALNEDPFASRYSLYPFFSSGIPLDVVGKTLFGVFLFQVFALIGLRYVWVPLRLVTRLARREDRMLGGRMDVACLLVSLLSFVPFGISAGGDPVLMMNRLVEMRNAEVEFIFAGEEPGLWIHLVLLGIFGGTLSSARFIAGVPGSNVVRIVSVALSALWVFLSGTRFLMIFLLLPALLVLKIQITSHTRTGHIRMKLVVIGAVAALAILAQAAIRDMGVGGYSTYGQASAVIQRGAVGYEHFEAMAIAIDLADREDKYFHEFLLPVVVRHFIPRVWWPEKPDWESWAYYNEAVTGSASFNVTPSVTGEYYLNWGMWGICYIGLFFGWLVRCADEWVDRTSLSEGFSSAVFCGFFYGFLFVSFRILSPIYIAYVIGAGIVFLSLTTSARRLQ